MELVTLIKMLFREKPNDVGNVNIISMKHYPWKGYRFMMWCGNIIYRKDKEQEITEYLKTESGKNSIRHETAHLKQAQLHGKNSWIRYYWKYFIEWVKGNPIIHPSESAYYTIPFEVEAYALEENQDAIDNYDSTLLKSKYTLKNRKQVYRDNRFNWKEFVKSL